VRGALQGFEHSDNAHSCIGILYLAKGQVEEAQKQLDSLKAAEQCKGGMCWLHLLFLAILQLVVVAAVQIAAWIASW
jgi:hypothetical protein